MQKRPFASAQPEHKIRGYVWQHKQSQRHCCTKAGIPSACHADLNNTRFERQAEGWVLCILPQCIAHRSQCICPLHRQYLYTSHQARDWHSEVASSSAEASCLQLQLHHVPVPGRETQALGSTTLVTLKYHFWVPKASTRILATSKLGGIPLSDNATDLFIRGTTSRLAVGAWLRAGTARVTRTVSELPGRWGAVVRFSPSPALPL